jgi:hypothetical protein
MSNEQDAQAKSQATLLAVSLARLLASLEAGICSGGGA